MRLMIAAAPALLLAFAFSASFVPGPVPAEAAGHTVTVADNSFTPATLNIVAGDTVNWTLSGGTHTVVADDGSFSSGILDSSGFSHTFSTPGTYEYFCSVHSSADLSLMNGVINVAAAQAAPTNTPQPQATITPQPEPTDTPLADATGTPVVTPTAQDAESTAADAEAVAASAGDEPTGGAARGSELPPTGTGPAETGAGTWWVVLLTVAVAVVGVVALGRTLAARRR